MVVDFSKITVYEVIALIMSFIAIIVPFVKWTWQKWFVKPVLNHLPTGKVYPFFNKLGSYLKIESVYEARNKPIVVKNISLRMTRLRDEKKLNEKWSNFFSPMTQSFNGGLSYSAEGAHPFRIEKDSLTTAFTEFEDSHNTLHRSLSELDKEVDSFIKECQDNNIAYVDAIEKFRNNSIYKKMYDILVQDFFWNIGKYKIEISVKYEKKEKTFSYDFDINEIEYNKLMHNLNETLLLPVKQAYKQQLDFYGVVLSLNLDE